eukprot:GHVU01214557.1.p1 GENE.GHVU01214557.1~~GHVU01214557.1.p1  ORF type:complete len:298 (-),score=40.23 GHVU01214557.1:514-1284(-)
MTSHGNSLVLFGGYNGTNGDDSYLNDMWKFDTDQHTWQIIEAAGTLPPGRDAQGVLKFKKFLYLFGGYESKAGSNKGKATTDVYRYSLDNNVWQKVITHGITPANIQWVSAAEWRDRAIIFSGNLYEFDMYTHCWERVENKGGADSPPRLIGYSAITHCNKLLLYGGRAGAYNSVSIRDIWEFDLETKRWKKRSWVSGSPPPRSFHSVVKHNNDMLIFGGGSGEWNFNDVWAYNLEYITVQDGRTTQRNSNQLINQ